METAIDHEKLDLIKRAAGFETVPVLELQELLRDRRDFARMALSSDNPIGAPETVLFINQRIKLLLALGQ